MEEGKVYGHHVDGEMKPQLSSSMPKCFCYVIM